MIKNVIKNYKFSFALIVILFIFIHVAGLNIPYHQDEYKWVYYADTEMTPSGTIPHPPLTEFIYTKLGSLVGDNYFRIIPFGFGLINLFLLFYLSKTISGNKTALWAGFLFTASFYSLLASLMVDVDGAVMPTFLLLMSLGYMKLRSDNFDFKKENWKWLTIFIVGAMGGLLIKMSGVLPFLAFFIDFALIKGYFSNRKKLIKFLILGALLVFAIVIVLLLAKIVFPFFPIEKSIKYWLHFANSSNFFNRGWFQTFIQFVKAILYTSPLLILPLFFMDKEIWQKTRPFFFFIFIGLFFYLFAFDFSIGALDRYFQFLIIPLCLIGAFIFSKNFENIKMKIEKIDLIFVSFITITIFSLQFFNHFVPALYPKTEWVSRVLSLKWNFLFPFTGGSGPTGFYVSFLFIAIIWICSIVFIFPYFNNKNIKKRIVFSILVLGCLYNGVFIEEYLFGKINGSPYRLIQNSVNFIVKNDSVKSVLVYNDIGGFEVRQTGKYTRRIYATPQFESTYRNFFKDWNGHIIYIDIPKMAENNFYSNYMMGCKTIYQENNKNISSRIFECLK